MEQYLFDLVSDHLYVYSYALGRPLDAGEVCCELGFGCYNLDEEVDCGYDDYDYEDDEDKKDDKEDKKDKKDDKKDDDHHEDDDGDYDDDEHYDDDYEIFEELFQYLFTSWFMEEYAVCIMGDFYDYEGNWTHPFDPCFNPS